jgi:glycosyltransferase involved in cell wall biosynthesis
MENIVPLVSVIMPAYNRADTIVRAIDSVRAQTIENWELIVVDDGSTDETASLVCDTDSRIRLIRQNNEGISGARNTGLKASKGKYIAFLDSDDEWLAHHLEICLAFLEAFPDQQFVTAELLEDFGKGCIVKHYQIEMANWYPELARKIGSHSLDLPPGETDYHMRVYQTREPIGPWGSEIVARTGYENVYLYTGSIFDHLRWGYLMVMQGTVLTRTALERVGLFDLGYKSVSDFGLMAELCRNYRANYLSIPTCIKHELNAEGDMLSQHHLASGKGAIIAAQEMLRWLEELFWNASPRDRELCAIRGQKQYDLAKLCFECGRRDEALAYIEQARSLYSGFWGPLAVKCYIKLMPGSDFSRAVWNNSGRVKDAFFNLLRGDLTIKKLVLKMLPGYRAVSTMIVVYHLWFLYAQETLIPEAMLY